jgi:hypothetical protein
MKKMIIGLGTGRCGSMSLSNLLSFQEDCLVSHEIGGRPWLPWKRDTKLFENYYNLIHSRNYEIIGDVSFYNLPYASDYLNKSQKTVFVILQRDKQDTINSYLKKTEGRNHWIVHNGSKWRLDSWDKCYPKFDVTEKEEALSDYYDHYYESCRMLPQEKCFWMKTQDLNNEQKCIEMLNFCGFESPSFIKLKRNSSS